MVARLLTPVLAALAVFASGCGGSGADEVVRDYFTAIVEQNGGVACEQLSQQLRTDIERAPAVRGTGRTCADVMELAAGLNPGLSAAKVDELEIEVSEDGDRAVATLKNPLVRREETIDLVQEGGEWRISTLEVRPGG